MSMPFLIISCDRCEYSGSSTVAWGRFEYRTSSGLMPIKREVGWCQDCAAAAPIEVLPSLELVGQLEADISKAIAGEEACRAEARAMMPAWKRKLGFKVPLTDALVRIVNTRMSRQDDLRDALAGMSALAGRQSPPRCLECGGDRVARFPASAEMLVRDSSPETRRRKDSGLHHPGCGGKLTFHQSDFWVARSLSSRTYDVEGRLLADAKDDT